jgi:hypothetical protein
MEDTVGERIHIVVGRAEKERFRRVAAREGKTLSEWLRDAARARLAASREASALDSRGALRDFFAACVERERGRGREPDWHVYEAMIERSKGAGAAES